LWKKRSHSGGDLIDPHFDHRLFMVASTYAGIQVGGWEK